MTVLPCVRQRIVSARMHCVWNVSGRRCWRGAPRPAPRYGNGFDIGWLVCSGEIFHEFNRKVWEMFDELYGKVGEVFHEFPFAAIIGEVVDFFYFDVGKVFHDFYFNVGEVFHDFYFAVEWDIIVLTIFDFISERGGN